MHRTERSMEGVAIVGEPDLCRRFSTALGRLGVSSEVFDGKRAALNGFAHILREPGCARDTAVAS
jgi:2-keto-3-deoxy-galactonokinase